MIRSNIGSDTPRFLYPLFKRIFVSPPREEVPIACLVSNVAHVLHFASNFGSEKNNPKKAVCGILFMQETGAPDATRARVASRSRY